MAISINKQNLTHEFIEASKVFTVSILSKEAPMALIGHFGFKSGRDLDKFKEVNHRIGTTGAPIVLENTIGFMECEVLSSTDVGTHTIFIGKIVDCEVLNDAEPMTYAYYHQVKGGKSPKTAPTYVKEDPKEEAPQPAAAAKYKCNVCGYVYDSAVGDPDGGIQPGTTSRTSPRAGPAPSAPLRSRSFPRKHRQAAGSQPITGMSNYERELTMTNVLRETNILDAGTLRRGKVRDVYDLGERLLIVATDRLSAFDVVLPTGIEDKGKVLTKLSIFWFRHIEGIMRNHIIETDATRIRKNCGNTPMCSRTEA